MTELTKRPFSITAITSVLYSDDASSTLAGGSCEQCGKPTNNPRFCSLKCSVHWQNKARAWAIGYCKNCSKVFNKRKKSEKQFCTSSCAATYNNKRFPKKTAVDKSKKCLGCGDLTNNPYYCSTLCQQQSYYEKRIANWLAGNDPGYSTIGNVKPYIRKWLFDKYNSSCSKCGWSEVNPFSNKIPLDVEHIDGNWKNNRPENLLLLCPNCHSLTSTYRALNHGKGREMRRK